MQTLERTHEMLAPLERLVTGSGTVDNARLVGLVEGAILASTGSAITTGMIMKRIRVAANWIPGVKERSLQDAAAFGTRDVPPGTCAVAARAAGP